MTFLRTDSFYRIKLNSEPGSWTMVSTPYTTCRALTLPSAHRSIPLASGPDALLLVPALTVGSEAATLTCLCEP